MSKKAKKAFIPVQRVDSDIKAILMREADRQERTLTNYLSIVYRKEAERILEKEKTGTNKA